MRSQFLLSFYGGAVPLAWIAYQNAERLGLPRETRTKIAVAGVAMTMLLVALAVALLATRELALTWFDDARNLRTVSRLLFRAGGVVLYLIVAAWQKPGDRRYATFGTGEYDSLWKPGLIATVVADVVLIVIMVPLAMLFK
jgi:hypothetical protein